MKKATVLICIVCLLVSVLPAAGGEMQWEELFSQSANEQNPALVFASAQASDAVYYQTRVRAYLESNGFDPESIEMYDYQTDAEHSTAFTLARRRMADEKNTVLYAVLIRGTMTLPEAISNFVVGNGNTVQGFYLAAERVRAHLLDYLKRFPPAEGELEDGNYRLWICGHSRGGAVANLLAGELLPDEIPRDQTYVYTFGTPNTVKNPAPRENIFNFIIASDLLASLPPSAWGFGRYGQNIVYNGAKVNRIQLNSKEKVDQLLNVLTSSGLDQQTLDEMMKSAMENTENKEAGILTVAINILSPLMNNANIRETGNEAFTLDDVFDIFSGMMTTHIMPTYMEWLHFEE